MIQFDILDISWQHYSYATTGINGLTYTWFLKSLKVSRNYHETLVCDNFSQSSIKSYGHWKLYIDSIFHILGEFLALILPRHFQNCIVIRSYPPLLF